MAQRLLLLRTGLNAVRQRLCTSTTNNSPRLLAYSATCKSQDFFTTQYQSRWFHSSNTLRDDEKESEPSQETKKKKSKEAKKQAKAAAAAAAAAQDDDKKDDEGSKEADKKDDGSSKEAGKKDSKDDDDDDVPPWQNPLHEGNPDYQSTKVFEEDFAEGEEIPAIPLPPMDDGSGKALAPPHLHELADEIVNLTMLEMNDLTNKIGDHFGFEDSPVGAVVGVGEGEAASSADAGEAAPAEEGKTAFDLKLVAFDAKAKIKVIKEVRAIGGFGLKEAKEMVEGAPKIVKKGIKMEEAEELKKKLEEVGATVEIA